MGLKGSKSHIAFVAENLKMSFPLLTTTNVWNGEIIRWRTSRWGPGSRGALAYIPFYCGNSYRCLLTERTPAPKESRPACGQVSGHPVPAWGPVGDLHLRLHHRTESRIWHESHELPEKRKPGRTVCETAFVAGMNLCLPIPIYQAWTLITHSPNSDSDA